MIDIQLLIKKIHAWFTLWSIGHAGGTEKEGRPGTAAELDQSNSPGLLDHLLVSDDLETSYQNMKVVGPAHWLHKLSLPELFKNKALWFLFLKNHYCNLQRLLSLEARRW